MPRNLAHIASTAFNEPLMLEPAYARVFFSALGKETGTERLIIPQENALLSAQDMEAVTASFMSGDRKAARFYEVRNGIAVLPVTGSLVHKLGAMRPFSGMTGYDGIIARLTQAMADPEVRGVMLDIDSPGGQVAGAFDCADLITRLRAQKPIWALTNDMACSAAMLMASACTRRLTTQTGRMGSVGVLMAHTNIAGALEKEGREITLIFAGSHKTDGNPYSPLPDAIRAAFQTKMEDVRLMFAQKVAQGIGVSVEAVLATEAAVYDGAQAVAVGFADELVNSADAVELMAAALTNKTLPTGDSMTTPQQAAELAAQERQRVMGILGSPAAKGREALANALALQEGMTVVQAEGILNAAPASAEGSPTVAERIMALPAAKGRETLASLLADDPGMTLDKAEALLSASPAAAVETASLRDQLLACPVAKGREALAEALASDPGMTHDRAVELLSLAPVATGTGALAASFERFMTSDAAPSAGNDVDGGDEETARLGSFIGRQEQ
ncbi:S49 family peptidase [Lelliottia sp. SL45]|uniref:S49 family peptidase n=1 Tax=Lelliottia sp. SL45 TaxID=2994665 RepID=UPI00227232CE|nr:S49 family peptidase [Lelliottia sp. SL45]MCY1698653.1 S49 family peptidase [Lelliottia sp. SL45]